MRELTPEELQTPRTAAQFLPWVEQRMEEFGTTDAGIHAQRFGVGLAKQRLKRRPLGITVWTTLQTLLSTVLLFLFLLALRNYFRVK